MEVRERYEGSEERGIEDYEEAQRSGFRYWTLKLRRVLSTKVPHRCQRCGRLFLAGSSMTYKVLAWTGEFVTNYTCPRCEGGSMGGEGWT